MRRHAPHTLVPWITTLEGLPQRNLVRTFKSPPARYVSYLPHRYYKKVGKGERREKTSLEKFHWKFYSSFRLFLQQSSLTAVSLVSVSSSDVTSPLTSVGLPPRCLWPTIQNAEIRTSGGKTRWKRIAKNGRDWGNSD